MHNSARTACLRRVWLNIARSAGLAVLLWVANAAAVSGPAAGVEIWITPTGKGGGSGTATDPFSTPGADSFFDLIHDQRVIQGTNYVIPEFSTIHLMPGVFQVREGFLPGQCPRH